MANISSPSALLAQQKHRPWPLPSNSWIMTQIWRDLLFAHWAVPVDTLRAVVPPEFPLDTFDGRAWLTVTPFHMAVGFRALPDFPTMSNVPELNCRTYVTVNGKPGVYFFSLDTSSRIAIWGARTLYHLPYVHARMEVKNNGALVQTASFREHARWRADYQPMGGVHIATPGTLDHFLTERYCLYTRWHAQLYRADIHHLPWPLQHASTTINENSIAQAVGITLDRPSQPDVLAYASELHVLIWSLTRVAL
jgi:uncharacterized protein YqjF (DUF2071 family)